MRFLALHSTETRYLTHLAERQDKAKSIDKSLYTGNTRTTPAPPRNIRGVITEGITMRSYKGRTESPKHLSFYMTKGN